MAEMHRLRSLRQVLEVTSTVAVLCAASGVVWKLWLPPSRQKTAAVEDVGDLTINAKAISNVMGQGSVAVVEFSDFQCPYCGKYAANTWPRLKHDFVDSGKTRYIAMQYPLERIHPLALKASQAAECAGRQGKFWEMRDRLFESKALALSDLSEHANRLGLEKEAFRSCLEKEQTRSDIKADLDEGTRLGVQGTPMFFIGLVQSDGDVKLTRRIRGAASFEVFRAEIENALSVPQRSRSAEVAGRSGLLTLVASR
jgi:protein-disulfide isomerase